MMIRRTLATKACFLASIIVTGFVVTFASATAFVPLIDGGKDMPKLYDGWFNDQIAKQASTAVSKAISDGKKNIEVNFPPVPNVDEVRFGTPLNQKFGKTVVARDIGFVGGYKPGSAISRNLIAYSNVYWAKKIASAVKGGPLGGKPVCVLTADLGFNNIKKLGDISRTGQIMSQKSRAEGKGNEAIICCNPGGEETWKKLVSAHGSPNCPFVILNNSVSTSYDVGNKKGFDEVYYLKRISKGWIFRQYPNPWQAILEKPDGTCEVLKTYKIKPSLRDVSALVRDESFKRYAINNDRWTPGFGERL